MKKVGKIIFWVILIIIVVFIYLFFQKPELIRKVVFSFETTKEQEALKAKDLVFFSVTPGQRVSGRVELNGSIRGGWFFEGNIMINVLDKNKVLLKSGNAQAVTDWMTVDEVEFEGEVDFTGLPKGFGFIQIHNDNASGVPENDKLILLPIVIE